MFLDRSFTKAHYVSADVLDPDSELVGRLKGQLDIVYISLFLHVFEFDQQVEVAKRVLDLLTAKTESLIVCRVIACQDQNAYNATTGRLPYYYHSMASWKKLWERVQCETNVRLRVHSWEQEDALAKKHPLPGIYMLGSSIRRE